ncbi:hypothetical protein TL16_g08921 [Triparma laevis f. inornata]|uniref:Uncharacterized protein n=1 Tax=Triparma laevis f. inornata TaxID=1714386 RepID=A0A9W7B5E4_9STRA|nr:hypothetical protein TL16_g08921 [Triparma laevis f. inornata]
MSIAHTRVPRPRYYYSPSCSKKTVPDFPRFPEDLIHPKKLGPGSWISYSPAQSKLGTEYGSNFEQGIAQEDKDRLDMKVTILNKKTGAWIAITIVEGYWGEVCADNKELTFDAGEFSNFAPPTENANEKFVKDVYALWQSDFDKSPTKDWKAPRDGVLMVYFRQTECVQIVVGENLRALLNEDFIEVLRYEVWNLCRNEVGRYADGLEVAITSVKKKLKSHGSDAYPKNEGKARRCAQDNLKRKKNKKKKKKKNQKQKAQEFERNAKWAMVFILIGAWTGLLGARKEDSEKKTKYDVYVDDTGMNGSSR